MQKSKKIIYLFIDAEGNKNETVLELSQPELELINHSKICGLKNVFLEFNRCPNCPLSVNSNRYCPVALKLWSVFKNFKMPETDVNCETIVITNERTYTKAAKISEGIASLWGLILITSGCPILDILRPMAFLPIPILSGEEMAFRVKAIYLLGQHYRMKNNQKADWNIDHILNNYNQFNTINKCLLIRFKSILSNFNMYTNALKHLDKQAIFTVSSIEKDLLPNIKNAFHPYFKI